MKSSAVIDRIVIAVPDLSAAVAQYRQLLGPATYMSATEGQGSIAWWCLPNTVLELVQRAIDEPCIQDIVFRSPDAQGPERPVPHSLGVNIDIGDGAVTADLRSQQGSDKDAGLSVDHVVLRTDDAGACINLFEGELGIRLALDKTVPQWGGRMLFFRTGKLTLEVIESNQDAPKGSFFWGIAYQCRNLELLAPELSSRGVLLSDIRQGRKPGTRVATVKSHCLGIPTLLVQPAP